MFYDYVDSGSWTESTYRANERDLATICFRQRAAVNIENRSIRSTMIGEDVVMPVALAPTGLRGMQHADGEILAARAAEAFGIPFCLSTMSICSIEDMAGMDERLRQSTSDRRASRSPHASCPYSGAERRELPAQALEGKAAA
jgi:isopentenyl diphosphate isomerase/L-lactate dehydrogenase-like FMN-dependent dehydrogenase